MPVERSKKTINAWAKFLATPEGQEGVAWLRDQLPVVALSDGPHILNFSSGQLVQHLRTVAILEHELPVPPEPKKQDDEPGLIPRD
jgi:hypothetical protein